MTEGNEGRSVIFLEIDTDLVSDRMEQFLNKLVEAESMSGTPQFDALMEEAYALYDKLSDEERLWFDEQAEANEKPSIN